jgi:predicted amidophosphoribosyltransferase
MINKLMQIIAPHYCYGCAKVGTTLCDECKYDIVEDACSACIVCQGPSRTGICNACRTSYDRAWYVGERDGTLRELIDAYKFDRVVSASEALASLLNAYLPVLPADVVVVPVPSIAPHIRRRGYDHTLLIAKRFATVRKLKTATLLHRADASVQLGKNRRVRFAQAQASFLCNGPLDPDATYLIVDDIVTTNATLRACAEAMRLAGAQQVWVAVLARQPLDK